MYFSKFFNMFYQQFRIILTNFRKFCKNFFLTTQNERKNGRYETPKVEGEGIINTGLTQWTDWAERLKAQI